MQFHRILNTFIRFCRRTRHLFDMNASSAPDSRDAPMPVDPLQPDHARRSPPRGWSTDQVEPTSLIVFWPHEQPLSATEAFAALGQTLGVDQLDVHEPADVSALAADENGPEVQWLGIVQLGDLGGGSSTPALPVECIVYAEPARAVAPGQLGNPDAEQCAWVIGFEFLLDDEEPLDCYIAMMRLIAEAFPDAPAVLDVNCMMCRGRDHLEETFLHDEVEPAADCLWTIHILGMGGVADDGAERPVWLQTRGLGRCGMPELEMLEVDGRYAKAAAELLSSIVELVLDSGMPDPGEHYEIGQDLWVTFQPWQEVTRFLDPHSPGANTNPESATGGTRAVVCDHEPRGTYRKVWRWPERILQNLSRDEAAIYRTRRATARQGRLARATLDELATAFAMIRNQTRATDPRPLVADEAATVRFLIKAGFREHDEIGKASCRERV